MASIFGHAAGAATFHFLLPSRLRTKATLLAGIFCSTIPDADILSFRYGIPYEHILGHRGITHSIFFSCLLAWLILLILHRKLVKPDRIILLLYYFICTVSHALLDACTTGGRGVALWAPLSDERIFLPFRVIQVSPIGAARFFSDWGLAVLQSEFLWIGIPCLVISCLTYFLRKWI